MKQLSAERASEALMTAGGVFYLYWFFGRPNPTGLALAVGTLLGAASLRYRPSPKPLSISIGLAAILFFIHLWRGNPLAFAGGYLVGIGFPWLIYRIYKK